MKKVYADPNLGIKKNIDFALPKDPLTVTIDCGSYKQQQQQPTTNEADKKLNF
jgi:penicillin-binding protein 1A